MDGNGNIQLDPDVIGNGERSRIPLSDLYELPVFAFDTEQKARQSCTEETQRMKRIRREVFASDGREMENAYLSGIRSRLFETAPGLTVHEGAKETETVQKPWLSVEIIMIGWTALILGIWRLSYRKALRKKGVRK